jgi:light-regulated signal transduction histidine kinase (bacteriophytochrome)
MSAGRVEAGAGSAGPGSESGELARLQGELQQAREELADFTHSVSHDLRASLRHINAYLEIIQEDLGEQLAPDTAAHMATVSAAARQMGRQIEGLSELSRLSRLELQPSSVNLGTLLREEVAAIVAAAPARVIEWQLADDWPTLQGDLALIRQMLTQLLANACKFTSPRAVAVIGVQWQSLGLGWCRLTVSDNGVGFRPKYSDKLFHAFQRLHTPREFEGLGMGLALVRKIVERHGGTAAASAVLDGGCSVSVTLPVA